MRKAAHGLGVSKKVEVPLDVLDAWFAPPAEVISAATATGELLRCSPPLHAETLVECLAGHYGISANCIGIGAGSSEIIHRVFGGAIGRRVLLLDPTYSEYRFVAEARGAEVVSVQLEPSNGFRVDLDQVLKSAKSCSDIVIVNPNNPTGQFLTRAQVLDLRAALSEETHLWIDEAYADYCPEGTSVIRDAAEQRGITVIKSLSKCFALGGLRVAFWVGQGAEIVLTPPWVVSNISIQSVKAAIKETEYYNKHWTATVERVASFAERIQSFGLEVHYGHLNCVLIRCPEGQTSAMASTFFLENGISIRTPDGMGDCFGDRWVRISLPSTQDEELVLAVMEKWSQKRPL